jgi:hypothetical protein
MSTFLKPSKIASTGLGILRRETVIPSLLWRLSEADFKGAAGDTVSVRLPAFSAARSRTLRSGTARVRDDLAEQKVDVTLDTDIYKDVKISDEELTLDITNFGEQVLNPLMAGVAEKLEDVAISKIAGAAHAKSIAFSYSSGNAWNDLIVPARELLNKARVPQAGRVLAVGSGVETELLSTDLFVHADKSGSTTALEEAIIGRKAGFTIVSVPGLAPDEAYAFHATAFPLVNMAPVVPAGAPYGASESYNGAAIRVVRVLDSDTIQDVLALDSWVGAGVTRDPGYFDASGRFVPTDATPGTAVTLATSAAADDIIDTATAHGFVAGDRVVFPTLTGGTGLSTNREYYVIAANLAAQTFQVSTTPGGSAVNFSADATAGTVRKSGTDLLVRSVKITAS